MYSVLLCLTASSKKLYNEIDIFTFIKLKLVNGTTLMANASNFNKNHVKLCKLAFTAVINCSIFICKLGHLIERGKMFAVIKKV
jgi:hypothetical protein